MAVSCESTFLYKERLFENRTMDKIKLELEYGDVTILEFCLIDFIDEAKSQVTKLQNKEGDGALNPHRRELTKIYQNRIRNGKRLLGVISSKLDYVEVGDE